MNTILTRKLCAVALALLAFGGTSVYAGPDIDANSSGRAQHCFTVLSNLHSDFMTVGINTLEKSKDAHSLIEAISVWIAVFEHRNSAPEVELAAMVESLRLPKETLLQNSKECFHQARQLFNKMSPAQQNQVNAVTKVIADQKLSDFLGMKRAVDDFSKWKARQGPVSP